MQAMRLLDFVVYGTAPRQGCIVASSADLDAVAEPERGAAA